MTEVMTSGQVFYQKQLDFLYAKDSVGLIDSNYNADAVLHSFDNTIKGSQALKEYFKGYLEMLGDLKVKSTDKWTETDDTIFFEATVETGKFGVVHVFDAMVLRDGKISHHFTGVK
jgi:hypothetical protein